MDFLRSKIVNAGAELEDETELLTCVIVEEIWRERKKNVG